MSEGKIRVCPVWLSGMLDNWVRRWGQDPRKILSPYVQEGMTVLDVGCGPGFFSVEMAMMVGAKGKVIAADLQDGMLEKVRRKVRGTELEGRVKLVVCGQGSLNVTDKADFGLAFFVVHEVPDKERFFKELKSVLNEKGRVLLVEPVFEVSGRAFGTTLEIAGKAGFVKEEGPRLFLCRSAILKNI